MGYLALKLGPKVPTGAINLAWVSIPEVTPEQNAFVADLASTIPANRAEYRKQTLNANVNSYVVTLGDGLLTKTVSNSLVGRYSSPIRVMPPAPDDTDAWHLRVMDGVFHQRIKVKRQGEDLSWLPKAFLPGTEVVAIYTIPEKILTPHDDAAGFLDYVSEDEAFPTSSRTVQLSYRDISYVSLVTINGNSIAVATPENNWTNVNMTIDPAAGTITFLNLTIAPTDNVRVSYTRRSPHLTYRGYYDADGQFRDLDLNPATGHFYDNGKPSSRLVGRVITLFLIPTAAYDYQASLDGQVNIVRAHDVLESTPAERTFLRWGADLIGGLSEVPVPRDDGSIYVPRATYGSAKYGKDHFCTSVPADEGGSDNYSDPDGAASDLANYPSAVVLARVYVSSTGTADSVIVTDTRVRGGGLTDDPVKRRAMLTGEQLLEANTCWDISGWDGDPVMLNGTTVIEIPESVLIRRGGRFSESEVEEIVKKRLPVGVLPIIRYTSRPITVTDETAAVTQNVTTYTIKVSKTNLLEVTSVKWNGVTLDPSVWSAGVNYSAGTITITGVYTYPAPVLISYKY